MFVPPSLG